MTKSKRQKVKRLLKLFNNGHHVHIDGVRAEKLQVSKATGRKENQVLYLEWREHNESFSIKITEQGLAGAKISGADIEVEDEDGDPVKLQFQTPSGVAQGTKQHGHS